MTNYEANNNSSPPESVSAGYSWSWLADRLPAEGAKRLGTWMQTELDLLESTHANLITVRSLKHDLRHEFTAKKRSTKQSQSE